VQFVGVLLVFGGYTLVYAAVARGGRFATEPWAGLFADAYDPSFGQAVGSVISTAGQQVGGAIAGVGQKVGGP
jgi:hypothetical protein